MHWSSHGAMFKPLNEPQKHGHTVDEVVFAEKGDLLLLGSRTLEGLNLTIDPQRKKLVASGPVPAA